MAQKTADSADANPRAEDGYTVTFQNNNTISAVLASVADTLPAGFGYVDNSTTGAITSNPTITGQLLEWDGSFNVPAGGSLRFHFQVTVSTTAGTYTNSVIGASLTDAVAGATNVAPITVGSGGATTTTSTTITVVTTPAVPVDGLPLAGALLGAVGVGGWLYWRRRSRLSQ